MKRVVASPLTREAFAEFGDVLDAEGWPNHYPINDGMCERYHALARAEAIGPDAHVVISVFKARPWPMPLKLTFLERHPLGSQAFMPLSPRTYLVVVAHDEAGRPGTPHAFLTRPGQGVNYPRNLWHGVLTPLEEAQDFLVIDRAGAGSNVEEFHFDQPYEIDLP